MTVTTKLPVGTRVRVIYGRFLNEELLAAHPEGVIIDNSGKTLDGTHHAYKVDLGPDSTLQRNNGGPIWASAVEEVIEVPAPREGDDAPKLVASLPHQTSRDYAADSVSKRALPPVANSILIDAAAGKAVDVLELRKAATAALDLARTRGKDRPASADYAKKARHLIYWADAVIDQHVNELPVYEPGARSPRIAELERELTQLKQAASDERRRLCDEIDAHKDSLTDMRHQLAEADSRAISATREASELVGQVHGLGIDLAAAQEQNERYVASLEKVDVQIQRYTEIARSAEELADKRAREREIALVGLDELGEVLIYAFDHLKPGAASRVLGFWDGIQA